MRSRSNSSTGNQSGRETESDIDSEDEIEEELDEIKLLRSAPKRILAYTTETIKSLLLTTDELPDIAFEMAPDVLKNEEIMFFGIFRRFCFLAIFLYFAQSVFLSDYLLQPYMAVDRSSTNVCKNVGRTWTIPSIKADYDASWEGQLYFQTNKAVYIFSLFNFVGTASVYYNLMSKFETALRNVGERAKQQDLALNLIYW